VTKEVEKVVEVEKMVEVEKEIEKVVTATPSPRPEELVFVYLTVDNDEVPVRQVMTQFESDYGVPVRWEQTPNVEESRQKILSLTLAGEQLDTVVLHSYDVGKWVEEGIVQPLDGLPGLDEYLDLMSPSIRDLITYQGQIWGLPHFISLNTYAYNMELFEQTGLGQLPASLEEMAEMSQKIKADGLVEYPIVWQAGVGSEHIGDTYFSLVASVGGELFDEELNPLFDEGSVAREMLKWWRQTFIDWEIADPTSLEARWIPAMKAHASGDYLFTITRERYMNYANDPELSPTPGKHQIFKMGHHMFSGHMWGLASNAYDRDYSWKLLQYFGGHEKSGRFSYQTDRVYYSLATGWPEIALQDPGVKNFVERMYDPDEYARQWEDAVYIGTTCRAYVTPWYAEWVDKTLVPNLQNCLAGSISAEEAAGNMAKDAEQLRG
jgi:multiple sugar transport system substrate-binding protein